uniref:Methyltranfer_dom domain-containing protein n=1 Tax=Glossina brevipalpis TaxID=37001 RepID=A0A1A9X3N4_9MUSC
MKELRENLQRKLLKSLKIIRTYDWLIDSYVLDFYVKDHWSEFPNSWQQVLENATPQDLCYILDFNDEMSTLKMWPLSLLTLKVLFKELCIKRRENETQSIDHFSPLLRHPKLTNIFAKGVKHKKRHELELMASTCAEMCQNSAVDFIVDFGAGIGHLARVLGFGYGIKVCCLEMQYQLNKQAEEIDEQMISLIKKYLPPKQAKMCRKPIHLNLCLTSTTTPEAFIRLIQKSLELNTDDYKFGIIGLHSCGDLAANLIHIFLNCKQAKFINLVGCCYMKLSINDTTHKAGGGYPLSQYLSQHSISFLSYEAREISCHAIEMYKQRLASSNYDCLKIHSFRAAAERIIVKHYPELRHSGLKSIKHSKNLQFEDYFYRAVVGLPVANISVENVMTAITERDLSRWWQIVVYYTLRLFFGPLIESIILYDRILLLIENGCTVNIKAVFKANISPRNHITTAVKNR